MSRVRLVAVLAVVAMAVAACQPTVSGSPATSPSTSTAPTSPIEGVVTNVASGGLNEVSSFDLRTDDGRTYTFTIGELENAVEFPPGHLREHMATSSPVRVFFEAVGAELVVNRIEDAD
jgi:hypothetical protein